MQRIDIDDMLRSFIQWIKTMILTWQFLKKVFLTFGIVFMLNSCSFLFTYPDQLSQEERFLQLNKKYAPINNRVTIYWDKYSIPFIETLDDDDLAFAIGVVHAHLRIDQLELLQLISQGRLSEVAGPLPQVKKIDHALRMINFKRAAQKSIQQMNQESQQWMHRYTEGINWYLKGLKDKPITNRLLDKKLTPYSMEDIMAIAKLISSDLTWIVYLKYLKYAEKENWQAIFNYSLKKLETDSASYHHTEGDVLPNIFKYFSKSGSNSIVIGGEKTTTGAAMIASDPHVGLMLPNFWIMMGVKSKNYHTFGLMIPGIPAVTVGRNKHISWGGTNMRGISSHLYDVTHLKEPDVKVRKEIIKRRWWFNASVDIRETQYGPIISDIDYFDKKKLPFDVALNWVGHYGSDEIQSFLDIMRAKNWNEFKHAFSDYKVSAMNMLYADDKGNIGMISAYGQPVLKEPSKTLELIKSVDNPIVGIIPPTEHTSPYNPHESFLASANNKPLDRPVIPMSYSFSNNDRFERLKTLASIQKKIHVEHLKQLQLDVYSQKSMELKTLLFSKIKDNHHLKVQKYLNILHSWHGQYEANSQGAVIFYVLMHSIWQHYLVQFEQQPLFLQELRSPENWKSILLAWLPKQDDETVIQMVKAALDVIEETLSQYPTWGDFTVQGQKTFLGLLPLIGSRFSLSDYPLSGGNDTLNKYGRPFSREKSEVFYGASARHISDMSSIDENYFILHGGQDSWMMNENIADQTALWRKGEYIKIPLSLEKVKDQFNAHIHILEPELSKE